jgi:NTP pyrophosphatase (non-canonical NTP hydrolase)
MADKTMLTIPKEMRSLSASGFQKLIKQICQEIDLDSTREVIENNIVHSNESVYDHTLDIAKKLIDLLSLDYIGNESTKQKAQKYFVQKIGNYSRAELFILSAYLHDIGKKESIQTDENGKTSCPNHERISANIAIRVLVKLKLHQEDIAYIYNVVKLHGGYSLRFLDYLQTLTKPQLEIALGSCYLLPEKLLYQVADNEVAKSFSEYKDFIYKVLLQNISIYKNNESNASKVDLNKLFLKISNKIKMESKPWPEEARMLHLSEEVGELHDIYLQFKGAKDREQTIEHIKGALNDIVFELVALYDMYGLDMGQVLEDEIDKDE